MERTAGFKPFSFIAVSMLWGSLICASADDISCRDQNGNPVDWFVVYKLPDMNDHGNKLVREGVGFFYMDASSKKGDGWQMSAKGINVTDTAVGATLQQIYDRINNTEVYHVMYNDRHPNDKDDGYRGHTKGAQLFDERSGLWLVHSVPGFPDKRRYAYPDFGRKFGQSMLCVTFDTSKSLGEIGEQLFYYQTSLYSANVPSSFAQKYPALGRVAAKKSQLKEPFTRRSALASRAGAAFTSFAKCKKWTKDLYADLIAPSLKQSLFVETWLNGPSDLPSVCHTDYTVHNARAVAPAGVRFTSSRDHSKWAVADTGGAWVCVGDINRQKSQDDRAGGAVCFESEAVWQAYRHAVVRAEACHEFDVPPPTHTGAATVTQLRPCLLVVVCLLWRRLELF